jgi:hypothetical protein
MHIYDTNFQNKSIYDFHIFKLNDLKVIHDLYSQCLTQTMSKMTSNSELEGVRPNTIMISSTYKFSCELKSYNFQIKHVN